MDPSLCCVNHELATSQPLRYDRMTGQRWCMTENPRAELVAEWIVMVHVDNR